MALLLQLTLPTVTYLDIWITSTQSINHFRSLSYGTDRIGNSRAVTLLLYVDPNYLGSLS